MTGLMWCVKTKLENIYPSPTDLKREWPQAGMMETLLDGMAGEKEREALNWGENTRRNLSSFLNQTDSYSLLLFWLWLGRNLSLCAFGGGGRTDGLLSTRVLATRRAKMDRFCGFGQGNGGIWDFSLILSEGF